jgi:hypothetical protein
MLRHQRVVPGNLIRPDKPDLQFTKPISPVVTRPSYHANRCDQPAPACEVHHLTRKANGGKTSVRDCILFCTFHHQVVIHQMGWTVVLNPDGTTTAWNPDKTKILHSHSPPADTG